MENNNNGFGQQNQQHSQNPNFQAQQPQSYPQNPANPTGPYQQNYGQPHLPHQQNYGQPQYAPQAPAPAPVQQAPLDFSNEIRTMIAKAGTLELTAQQNDILYAPVKDHDVFIKPDGLIYLSWMKYSERLNKAFGGTAWTMIPEGTPRIMAQNNLIVWGFHFIIKGVYCGFAIGEQQYFDNNRMSYGEACEGAKSNALMRLCKNIGIGLELWDKNFIDRWVATYAESYLDQYQKTKWKLKTGVQQKFLQLQAMDKGIQPNPTTNPQQNAPQQNAAPATVQVTVSEDEKPAAKKRGKKSSTNVEQVPVVPITDNDLGVSVPETAQNPLLNEKTQPFYDTIKACTSAVEIRPIYEKIKLEHQDKKLTEEEKEFLRNVANETYVKLSAIGS